jgi:hypothetical protein
VMERDESSLRKSNSHTLYLSVCLVHGNSLNSAFFFDSSHLITDQRDVDEIQPPLFDRNTGLSNIFCWLLIM